MVLLGVKIIVEGYKEYLKKMLIYTLVYFRAG